MFERILVPLDGSTRAERALPVAARIAQASGGTRFCQNSNTILAQRSHFWYADLILLTERGTLINELPPLHHNKCQGTSKENQTWLCNVLLPKLSLCF